MEYGLGLTTLKCWPTAASCLNPCFNGIWSRTGRFLNDAVKKAKGLNPCFNGIWSRTENVEEFMSWGELS